jgi:hypothetical protein
MVLGWIGMVSLLFAYWRREFLGRIVYAVLNLCGALLLAVNCAAQAAWPATALECAWATIALVDIARARRLADDP